MREAFHTDVPVNDFTRASSLDGWADTATGGRDFINDLLANLNQVREYAPSRPYWPARRAGPTSTAPPCNSTTGRQEFADLIGWLNAFGYLDRDFSEPCAYGDPDYYSGGDEFAPALEQRLGRPDLWPLRPESWDEDTFYGLIEVFHDLVARPRS